MAKQQLTCAECGSQFKYDVVTARPKCCGKDCELKRNNRSRRQKRKLPSRIEAVTYECWWCGSHYHPKRLDRNKACSRECGFKVRDFIRSIKANGGRVTHRVKRRHCDQCGAPFTTRNGAVCCSNECRRVRELEAIRKASKAKHVAIERPCKECGKAFAPEYGTKLRAFCSKVCGQKSIRRTARKKERARLRGAKVEAVNPTTVFDRDCWKCQHCGSKTPRKLRGSYDDRAPEIDHIIPLAHGGEHSYRNTQCLCRACNAAKSDGPGGQLRLFG